MQRENLLILFSLKLLPIESKLMRKTQTKHREGKIAYLGSGLKNNPATTQYVPKVSSINPTRKFCPSLNGVTLRDLAVINKYTSKDKTIKLATSRIIRIFDIPPLSIFWPSINPQFGINDDPTTLSINK